MLFASQSLEEEVQRERLDGRPGPHESIAATHKLAVAGNKTEVIEYAMTSQIAIVVGAVGALHD